MARAVSFGGVSPPKHRPRRLQKIKSVPITRGGGHTGEVKGKGWITATPPPNNKERIEKLKSYNVLDTPPEVSYDAITNIAAALCGAPMAAISLVDDTRQFFKSRFGIDATGTPIDQSFCSHTIVDVSGFMEVRDATKDERFYGNPLVAGDFALRFYAGAALITPDDHALGALCVLDKKPRQLDKYQTDALKALSRLVVDQLESRAHNLQLIELSNKLKESQKKLEEANAELMAQNSVLKKQIKELGNKQAEIELNAPVAKVVDLLSNIHSHIHDRQQKVLLQDAIKIIASNKLYEVDVEEAISAGTNVDNETKGFLLTQLDSPTGQKPDNLRGSGFLDGASADVADDVSTDDVNSGTSTVNSSSDDVNKGSEGVNKSSGSVTPTTMPVVRSKDFTRKFSIVPKTPDASIEIAKIDAVIGSVKDLTTNIEDWDFDVFKFSDTCKQPLFYSTLALLHKNDFFYKLPIPAAKLISFLTEVEKGYIHSNQYHNNVHAMDVMLSSHHIAKASGILQYITPSEHLALLLAAAVHDLGHLGVNNAFLIQTAHDIAIAHNDKSVLENYHCVQAFKLLYNTNNDFLENFSFVERQEIRKNMIELILATDMSHHVEIFNTFQNKRTTKEGLDVANNKQDRLLVLKMIIKCADISNSAKKNSFYLNWASRVMEEFWSQGDQERKLGMPVSAFMDRTQQDVPKCQTGFIQFIALPFYTAMLEQFPGLAHCVESMQENLNYWKNKQ